MGTNVSRRRKGVASVVGTIIFVLVFMLALGTLAYSSALQSQASQAEQQAQGVDALRAGESLSFRASSAGLEAVNGGGATATVNHVILRYPNGTVYSFAASAAIPAGGEVPVSSLVPAGSCSPGVSTCASRYEQIESGNPPGSSVGLLTSLGNVFWYTASGAQPGWSEVRFTVSVAWSVPSGASWAYVMCIGGGGGGGGSGGATDAGGPAGSGGGGGGGAGSFAQGFVDLQGASSVAVTVGQGGGGGPAGGTTTNGGSGGSGGASAFGGFMSCGGGQGGGGGDFAYNGAGGAFCAASGAPHGGSGDGVPGGAPGASGVASDALQYTTYGGGGGGGGDFYTPPGRGSPADSLDSGAIYTGLPGASGLCAFGGGGGSASPFADGGAGGGGASACGSGSAGGSAAPNTGGGGGGAGGSYSSTTACGARQGAWGGVGGSGLVVVYYQG
ncbi:MAG: hypothetical protein JRN13_03110 [Nitrososphaerota archaeon]|nr:hypothetical protein [Nitrososphaerota archaeon]MDG6972311.1 hypothetical protein [Nitrososphaerota archaeon]MDG6986952.1 hypothetical protein [Nitrososphaerota archaeon]MDG7017871.1 hypothetical protein [Nitrososphaerota archaeon]MDG7033823.1 hypothetical protein [Nitrososphaerota archaeon]